MDRNRWMDGRRKLSLTQRGKIHISNFESKQMHNKKNNNKKQNHKMTNITFHMHLGQSMTACDSQQFYSVRSVVGKVFNRVLNLRQCLIIAK